MSKLYRGINISGRQLCFKTDGGSRSRKQRSQTLSAYIAVKAQSEITKVYLLGGKLHKIKMGSHIGSFSKQDNADGICPLSFDRLACNIGLFGYTYKIWEVN